MSKTKTINQVKIGALSYPVKWVERYSLHSGCLIMHRTSQHERYVEDVVSSDFHPVKGVAPGVYVKVERANDSFYIHESDISHVRAFLGRYVEKLQPRLTKESISIDESEYWIMPYSYQDLVATLPDWVKASERSMVNHLRHYHSNYEQVLRSMRDSGNYSYGKYLNVFVWFNCEIGKYYPDLMVECQRQINEKLGTTSPPD